MSKANNIIFLNNLSKKDIKIAGGKGAHLGELMKIGINVPDGFVVLSSAFDEFIANKKISKDLEKEILNAFNKLNEKYVAVRSSATAEDSKSDAWADQLESYLYTTREDIFKNIKKCWLSLFSPKAISYRTERKLQNKKISVAVVVQKMLNPEISGVCFTVHPVIKNKNQIVIEAVWGLGETLVQGIITPDTYILEKNKLSIIDKSISEQNKQIIKKGAKTAFSAVSKSKQKKQKLSEQQIKNIANLCIQIEKHFKEPQDIEWVFQKGKFYIIQSRPITTLNK